MEPDTWTGGSSSGSAAAVAAGLLPFAIGSETWGSILQPANNCGVAGLRPTYGRVSRHGAMALCWTFDKLGPIAQTADDCGIILQAIAGPDPHDPTTIQKPWRYNPRPLKRRPRIAILRGVADDANPDVKDNFEKALKIIRGYADIDEIELPDLPYEAITRTILNAEAASAFEDIVDSGTILRPHGPRGPLGTIRAHSPTRHGLPQSYASTRQDDQSRHRSHGALRRNRCPKQQETRHPHRRRIP